MDKKQIEKMVFDKVNIAIQEGKVKYVPNEGCDFVVKYAINLAILEVVKEIFSEVENKKEGFLPRFHNRDVEKYFMKDWRQFKRKWCKA